MANTRAFSYLRVSGKGQVDGDGFDRQRSAITRYTSKRGIGIAAEFRDEGVSGTRELADRDGLVDLLARLKANGVDLVVVEKADRLARDLIVGELILAEFRELGVKVISVEAGGQDLTADDNDPSRVLIRQVLGAVAQFEKSALVIKLKAARDRKSRKVGRRVEGRKPFGMKSGEAETLARMSELHRKPRNRPRRGFAEIAHVLNEEGRPTRTGVPWSRQAVHQVIKRRLVG